MPAVMEVSSSTKSASQHRDTVVAPSPRSAWLDSTFHRTSAGELHMDIPGHDLCPAAAPDSQPGICESVLKSEGLLCCLFPRIVLRLWKASAGFITLMH